MVVADTNGVSELMRGEPSAKVLSWLDGRPTRGLFVTAVTEAEICTGIAFLPAGARRRVLPFDSDAARVHAEIVAARRATGRPFPQADYQIAAIAQSSGMAVATCNVQDFDDIGIEVIDPWAAA